ncbi:MULTISPECIES: hypothetical protein [Kitasatospora]|jgi:hypothetical protein|uniref:hypothetical protein n=1 Tax=Kitasatospora TaxID=2063 RepID=UPI000C70F496|nr:hypothetical protein [Kitasatospora sp. GP30]MDH6144655.1 hypothetical protein [Kitasatospora sp. GP30]
MSQTPAKSANPSTLGSRSTANPRRTILASLEDFSQLPGARVVGEPVEYSTELPKSTANPRRTKLMTIPEQQQA